MQRKSPSLIRNRPFQTKQSNKQVLQNHLVEDLELSKHNRIIYQSNKIPVRRAKIFIEQSPSQWRKYQPHSLYTNNSTHYNITSLMRNPPSISKQNRPIPTRDFRQGLRSKIRPKILHSRYDESSSLYLKNEGLFQKMHQARRKQIQELFGVQMNKLRQEYPKIEVSGNLPDEQLYNVENFLKKLNFFHEVQSQNIFRQVSSVQLFSRRNL